MRQEDNRWSKATRWFPENRFVEIKDSRGGVRDENWGRESRELRRQIDLFFSEVQPEYFRKGLIYLIKDPRGYYKIGYTGGSLSERLNSLRRSYGSITFLGSISGNMPLEQCVQVRLRKYRVGNTIDWFDLDLNNPVCVRWVETFKSGKHPDWEHLPAQW